MKHDADFRNLQLIWMALMGGVATYTVLIFALVEAGTLALGALAPSVVNLVAGATMVYMGAGLFVRRALIARIPTDTEPEARFGQYRIAVIIGLALIESGGLLIITLGMLASSSTWILAGGGAALGMMMLSRPTVDEAGGR